MEENENNVEDFDIGDIPDEPIEINTEDSGDDLEIEVVDDTPPQDRNRKPLEKEPEVNDDELQNYSKNVQERIKELRHGYHDERRAKESAEREREQAVALAQQILQENQRLKGTLKQGEYAFLEAARQKAAIEYDVAKRKLIEAKSNGDIEAEVTAQEEFNQAQLMKSQLEQYQNNALQNQNYDVNIPQTTQPVVNQQPRAVDSKAERWHKANPWFWKDRVMTGTALGLHEDLVSSGYDPQSDDYYRELDSRLRGIFPDKLGKPNSSGKKRPDTVVASASRSNPSKKVTLQASEVAIAKRLNLPLEVYAKQKMELEKRNG
jgi:hypothetical protein